MRKPKHNDDELDVLKKLGYETRDVNLPTLLKVLMWLGGFIVAMLVVSYGILALFVPGGLKGGSKSVQETRSPLPGIPVLQAQPKVDMNKFRAVENRKVESYGWVDKASGVAHVPVEIAIDEVAASGKLPAAEPGGTEVLPARGADSDKGSLPTGLDPEVPAMSNGVNRSTTDAGFEKGITPAR